MRMRDEFYVVHEWAYLNDEKSTIQSGFVEIRFNKLPVFVPDWSRLGITESQSAEKVFSHKTISI